MAPRDRPVCCNVTTAVCVYVSAVAGPKIGYGIGVAGREFMAPKFRPITKDRIKIHKRHGKVAKPGRPKIARTFEKFYRFCRFYKFYKFSKSSRSSLLKPEKGSSSLLKGLQSFLFALLQGDSHGLLLETLLDQLLALFDSVLFEKRSGLL